MFVFEDAHGRRLVLRPEMTAPIARLVASKLSRRAQPLRLGYIADCYRLDEPQWGRRRRFYHGGFELFGSHDPAADAEVLQICWDFFERLGIRDVRFKLGHVGVHRALMSAASIGEGEQDLVLSLIDRGRVGEAMKLAESKATDAEALKALRSLLELEPAKLSELLGAVGDIISVVDGAHKVLENLREIVELASPVVGEERLVYYPGFARGLSYYTGCIFEVYAKGAEVALAGGGRYDSLVELFGGRPTPGVGAALGLTRVLYYLLDKTNYSHSAEVPSLLLVPLGGAEVKREAIKLASELRRRGVSVELEVMGRSISDALSAAKRRGFKRVVILGERELERGVFLVKELEARVQREHPLSGLDEFVSGLVKAEVR